MFAVAMHEAWGAWSFGWIAPGIEIGNEVPEGEADLYQACFDATVAGRLDLTDAGVARGRALTTV